MDIALRDLSAITSILEGCHIRNSGYVAPKLCNSGVSDIYCRMFSYDEDGREIVSIVPVLDLGICVSLFSYPSFFAMCWILWLILSLIYVRSCVFSSCSYFMCSVAEELAL